MKILRKDDVFVFIQELDDKTGLRLIKMRYQENIQKLWGQVYNSSGTFSFVDLDFNDAILKLLKRLLGAFGAPLWKNWRQD